MLKAKDSSDLPEPVGYGKENKEERSYWLSFDRSHLTVKYGKGYHMVETTLLEYNFYMVRNFALSFDLVRLDVLANRCP